MKSHFSENRILVADDEPDVLEMVTMNLQSAGFPVIQAADGAAVLEKTRTEQPALIVLDLMMPGLSGLEVCKVLKASPTSALIPIIMLTAKAEEVDRVVGFELGADDYVTKPFSPRELVLRVKSVLRRIHGEAAAPEVQKVGRVTLDPSSHTVHVKGKLIDLTATEFKLLAVLMERCGRVQKRSTLLNDVWSYETSIDTRTVDTHIRRLREKLGQGGECIETVRGFGYRMNDSD